MLQGTGSNASPDIPRSTVMDGRGEGSMKGTVCRKQPVWQILPAQPVLIPPTETLCWARQNTGLTR